jgi:aspartyl/asparaginyl beta-hydroxylase (cupin superfamily)
MLILQLTWTSLGKFLDMTTGSFIAEIKRATVHAAGKMFLRSLSIFQAKHSLIPTTPIIGNEHLHWTKELENRTATIQEEFEKIWKKPEEIPTFHQISPDQARISRGNNWKTYGLFIFGQKIQPNCEMCPKTTRILECIPGLQNAWYSILAPGYHIPPHRGPTRALIRCHLGLMVPKERDRCWIRIGEEIAYWQEGKVLLFDDTYEHEVKNATNEHRAVLFMDVDRPMDKIGRFLNLSILRVMQTTHYVKDPLKNISSWNRKVLSRNKEEEQ